jgi:hypothetical protein
MQALLNRPALSFAAASNLFMAVPLMLWAIALRWRRRRAKRKQSRG